MGCLRTTIVAILVAVCASVTNGALDLTKINCCNCDTMYPEGMSRFQPQTMPSPFRIEVPTGPNGGPLEYSPGSLGININLTSVDPNQSFHAFMIQARRSNISGTETRSLIQPLGYFVNLDASSVKTMSQCIRPYGSDLSTVNNENNDGLKHIRLEWKTPSDFEGHLEIKATFVVDENTYWVAEKSLPIFDKSVPATSPKSDGYPYRYRKPPIPSIDVTGCGKDKGCYRIPADCREIECLYIVTWQHLPARQQIQFEMSAITDGFNDRYFALALSEDIYCGRDLVFECVHNHSQNSVEVYQSINADNNNINRRIPNPQDLLSDMDGSYNQGRLRCRFKRHLDASSHEELQYFDFGLKPYHLMMGTGIVGKNHIKYHGVKIGELPVTTPNEVDLLQVDDISDRARYHLVKAHACLMLLAWIFFAPVGLIWMKYYTTMWPNSRMFGERYWFVAHFNCTFWVLLLVFIGFILILVEGGGWSNIPDLPSKAHPILGIIAVICVFLIPVLALFLALLKSCSENNCCRVIVNWFYWLAWTIAFVLAVVNIFIGMDFGKAMVPWWLTWIICIFFLFNFICEIILEVHQCCTHKKNKERRKKWELQKKENPKVHIPEPWPAGRQFKKNVLFTHFIVALIVAIIAVLTVAIAN